MWASLSQRVRLLSNSVLSKGKQMPAHGGYPFSGAFLPNYDNQPMLLSTHCTLQVAAISGPTWVMLFSCWGTISVNENEQQLLFQNTWFDPHPTLPGMCKNIEPLGISPALEKTNLQHGSIDRLLGLGMGNLISLSNLSTHIGHFHALCFTVHARVQ